MWNEVVIGLRENVFPGPALALDGRCVGLWGLSTRKFVWPVRYFALYFSLCFRLFF